MKKIPLVLFAIALFASGKTWSSHVQEDLTKVSSDLVVRAQQLRRSIQGNLNNSQLLVAEVQRESVRIDQRTQKLRDLANFAATGGAYPHLIYRWLHLKDGPPNGCRGTAQGGDKNPYIVKDPSEMNALCTEQTEGTLFCDAGYENSRYLDRYWECAWE